MERTVPWARSAWLVPEMAPTVQCLTGSYEQAPPEHWPEFLDCVLNAPPERIRLSSPARHSTNPTTP